MSEAEFPARGKGDGCISGDLLLTVHKGISFQQAACVHVALYMEQGTCTTTLQERVQEYKCNYTVTPKSLGESDCGRLWGNGAQTMYRGERNTIAWDRFV